MQNVTVINSGMRHGVDFGLRLPVVFRWSDEAEHIEGGFTTSISRRGAYILCARCPPCGSDVRLEVLIESAGQTTGLVRLQCTGKVGQVFSNYGRDGFIFDGLFDDQQIMRDVDSQQLEESYGSVEQDNKE